MRVIWIGRDKDVPGILSTSVQVEGEDNYPRPIQIRPGENIISSEDWDAILKSNETFRNLVADRFLVVTEE